MSTTPQPLYRALAQLAQARHNCVRAGNQVWLEKHEAGIKQLSGFLPSGSGLDAGPKIHLDASHGEKLVFVDCDYHHMNEGGYYDGWTEHTVTAKGSLSHGVQISISGRNRNEIKDYIHEVFECALKQHVAQHETDPEVWAWILAEKHHAY